MKDTRKIKLLKSKLNNKLEEFQKLRISAIQKEEKEEVLTSEITAKKESKSFLSKILKI